MPRRPQLTAPQHNIPQSTVETMEQEIRNIATVSSKFFWPHSFMVKSDKSAQSIVDTAKRMSKKGSYGKYVEFDLRGLDMRGVEDKQTLSI